MTRSPLRCACPSASHAQVGDDHDGQVRNVNEELQWPGRVAVAKEAAQHVTGRAALRCTRAELAPDSDVLRIARVVLSYSPGPARSRPGAGETRSWSNAYTTAAARSRSRSFMNT